MPHMSIFLNGKWINIDDLLSDSIEYMDHDEPIPDDEIPFCDEDCSCCNVCDQVDDYDIVNEDEYDELYEGEPPFFWGIPDVRRIVFSGPATIVFWDDDTKTVVKCMEGEKFERYAGFAMACMKKMFGSTSRAKAVMEECDAENQKLLMKHEASIPGDETKNNVADPKTISLSDLISAFTSALKNTVESKGNDDEKAGECKDEAPAE